MPSRDTQLINNIWETLSLMYHFFRDKLLGVVSLQHDTDVEGAIDSIQQGIELKGGTVWILICAAMLASIGLDVNSVAVIIGAMLISPLMSPILGVGLGIGISDRTMFVDSLKNFGIAIAVSLGTAAVYFTLTPLGQPTSEMLARTTPTLLDVGVATFGGIAGIVANSRKGISTAIPGVAIATALMPPLCTAGYGLASFDLTFFLGAFYLFFINAVFISLSTFSIVRLLNFPAREIIDQIKERKLRQIIAVFAVLVMLPSIYLLFNVVQEAREKRNIKIFLESNFKNNDKWEAINYEILETDSIRLLKVYFVGEDINENVQMDFQRQLEKYSIDDFKLRLVQLSGNQQSKIAGRNEMQGVIQFEVTRQIEAMKSLGLLGTKEMERLKAELDVKSIDSLAFENLQNAAKIFKLGLKNMTIGVVSHTKNFDNNNGKEIAVKGDTTSVAVVQYDSNVTQLKPMPQQQDSIELKIPQKPKILHFAYLEFNNNIEYATKKDNAEKFKDYFMSQVKSDSLILFIK